jgi:hypothetical protein
MLGLQKFPYLARSIDNRVDVARKVVGDGGGEVKRLQAV